MKSSQLIPAAVLMTALYIPAASAQRFSSGSDGSYGPLIVTTAHTTVDVPPDGIFHCTTITVRGFILRFKRNALNTPVYLLSQSNIVIEGDIIVSGEDGRAGGAGSGGPGGFDGGAPGIDDIPPGD